MAAAGGERAEGVASHFQEQCTVEERLEPYEAEEVRSLRGGVDRPGESIKVGVRVFWTDSDGGLASGPAR